MSLCPCACSMLEHFSIFTGHRSRHQGRHLTGDHGPAVVAPPGVMMMMMVIIIHYNHPTGGEPRLDRRASIQFGRGHFGVFSTSRFVPLALCSNWT